MDMTDQQYEELRAEIKAVVVRHIKDYPTDLTSALVHAALAVVLVNTAGAHCTDPQLTNAWMTMAAEDVADAIMQAQDKLTHTLTARN